MSIQEILRTFRIDYCEAGQHHHARHGWIQIKSCPFCNSQNYHLGFNLHGRYFVCWRCGGHYAPQVLSRLGIPHAQVKDLFPQLGREAKIEEPAKRATLSEPKGRLPLKDCHCHQLYLLRRGLKADQIEKIWGIEGIKLAARLSWRLYIPVKQRGVRVSWTTRAIGEAVVQRYISASQEEEMVNIKKVVYGADLCSHTAVICEGPFDAWAIGPGAVALFGTAFTSAQVRRLSEFPYRFVVFDSSRDAQQRARKLGELLAVFPGMTQNVVLDAKDPAEASAVELARLRRACKL